MNTPRTRGPFVNSRQGHAISTRGLTALLRQMARHVPNDHLQVLQRRSVQGEKSAAEMDMVEAHLFAGSSAVGICRGGALSERERLINAAFSIRESLSPAKDKPVPEHVRRFPRFFLCTSRFHRWRSLQPSQGVSITRSSPNRIASAWRPAPVDHV